MALYFLIIRKTNNSSMDLFIIILSFLLAYGLFVFVAVKLAKVFFPKVDVDTMQMKPRRMRERHPKRYTI